MYERPLKWVMLAGPTSAALGEVENPRPAGDKGRVDVSGPEW